MHSSKYKLCINKNKSLAPNDNSVIYDRFAIESAKRILTIQNAKDVKIIIIMQQSKTTGESDILDV